MATKAWDDAVAALTAAYKELVDGAVAYVAAYKGDADQDLRTFADFKEWAEQSACDFVLAYKGCTLVRQLSPSAALHKDEPDDEKAALRIYYTDIIKGLEAMGITEATWPKAPKTTYERAMAETIKGTQIDGSSIPRSDGFTRQEDEEAAAREIADGNALRSDDAP